MSSQQEIRDPIHNFIRLEADEVSVLDSAPFQRLRHINQLTLTYLLYPGATHRRFEHSLGVMELASRVYDVVTNDDNVHNSIEGIVPKGYKWEYWRKTLRMAALCHDLGHLPFSHAAESELLPAGWNHERLTLEFIRSDEMNQIWDEMKIDLEDVAKLAVGPQHYRKGGFTDWEAILSEIIIGDAFGVDRMDYLLRDSHHIGVAYGRFDQYRLIDTLRILPKVDRVLEEEPGSQEPALGIEEGGLHSAEALLLARYFMFTQVYCHHVRRIYDIHLKDFLKIWLPGGLFPISIEDLIQLTDNDIASGLSKAVRDEKHPSHDPAWRIERREHFRLLYQRNPTDRKINLEASEEIFKAACEKYGKSEVRYDSYTQKGGGLDFPVLTRDGRIMSSLSMSEALERMPVVAIEYVYISPSLRKEADSWLHKDRDKIIAQKEVDEEL
jgi:HD superfamily phosphohydrolase